MLVQLGELTTSQSVSLPGDTLWALISEDSSGNLAGGLLTDDSLYMNNNTQAIMDDFAGSTIAAGNQIGGGTVVATGSATGSIPDTINTTVIFNIIDFPGLSSGDKLGIYWFPGRTIASNTLPSDSFEIGGFQRSDANSASGGEAGLVVPPDGYNLIVAYFDNATTSGGSGIDQKNFEAIAVPEPSTLFLLGTSILFYLLRRR
jgi:hypothetical protein